MMPRARYPRGQMGRSGTMLLIHDVLVHAGWSQLKRETQMTHLRGWLPVGAANRGRG